MVCGVEYLYIPYTEYLFVGGSMSNDNDNKTSESVSHVCEDCGAPMVGYTNREYPGASERVEWVCSNPHCCEEPDPEEEYYKQYEVKGGRCCIDGRKVGCTHCMPDELTQCQESYREERLEQEASNRASGKDDFTVCACGASNRFIEPYRSKDGVEHRAWSCTVPGCYYYEMTEAERTALDEKNAIEWARRKHDAGLDQAEQAERELAARERRMSMDGE